MGIEFGFNKRNYRTTLTAQQHQETVNPKLVLVVVVYIEMQKLLWGSLISDLKQIVISINAITF